MPSANWTRAVIVVAAGVWLAIAFFLDVPVDRNWLKYLGVTASLVVLILLAFDLYLWRWLPGWLVKRPVIRGTWKAVLRSSWQDSTGAPVEKTCYIVVEQTFSRVSVEMIFEISDSSSASAEIVHGSGRNTLWFVYRSEAHALRQDGNPPHRGAAMLHIGNDPKCLRGDYWTERSTVGRLETIGHSKKVVDNFGAAEAITYS